MRLLFFGILISASTVVMSQEGQDKQVRISGKTGGIIQPGSGQPDTITKYRTGIVVLEAAEGIVYRSHLRDYKEVTVELFTKEGNPVYQYKNEMLRNVNYNLAVDKVPVGEYILHFSTDDRLIVCNLQVRNM